MSFTGDMTEAWVLFSLNRRYNIDFQINNFLARSWHAVILTIHNEKFINLECYRSQRDKILSRCEIKVWYQMMYITSVPR
ncbi:hypothetical protein MTBBW1_10086 [Desulfamplus magnetovallimortis]|uniref:Uncharacterized protein n=1 Tax=Desulfamplus magnetovallimortis TaxID=1246637 RepID=A0A1W1H4P7_9BACT|nr:hypothetical protein MTBBW1_10086 [Desulfamplus magnetovallimortis]